MHKHLKNIGEYIPFYFFVKIVAILPHNPSIKLGRFLGRLFHKISKKRLNIARDNICQTLGFDTAKATLIAQKAIENIGVVFIEFIKSTTLKDCYFKNNLQFEGLEYYKEAKALGKGVLILSAHFGNWELLGASHNRLHKDMSVVFKKTSNPYINNFIESVRKFHGLKTIPNKNSIRKIMSTLKSGECVAILPDQHAIREEGIVVDFLGKPASTSYGLALIAIKTGVPVVPYIMVRTSESKYKCIYSKPIILKKGANLQSDIREGTIIFNKIIENYIKKYPDQWFWLHRRWKV